MKLTDKPNTDLIVTPPRYSLNRISDGNFKNNYIINECCARRLLLLCNDYGEDGQYAKKLLRRAFEKIELV